MTLSPLAVVGITRYHRPVQGYTVIRDSFLRDAQTSLRAFRVGAYVLSHAAGFVQTQRQIARACGLSVTTVRAALEDLERDRYVARRRVREGGRWIGTAYAVSDRPFTEEELAQLCPPCTESEHTEPVRTESVPPKKTTPARETTSTSKTRPSGGSPTGSLNGPEEEAMSTEPAAQALALFDLPPKPGRQPGANDIVAAYVDSYRRHHSGGNPLRRDIGRVARDIKSALDSGTATFAELTEAATAMGGGHYANIGVQVSIVRNRTKPIGRIAPVAPRGSFQAAHDAAQAEYVANLRNDPELRRWVAEDPAAVARLVKQHPSLAELFESADVA